MATPVEPKLEFTVRNSEEGLAALANYFDMVGRQMIQKTNVPNISRNTRALWNERAITMIRAAHVTRNTKFVVPVIVNNTAP